MAKIASKIYIGHALGIKKNPAMKIAYVSKARRVRLAVFIFRLSIGV